jgi:4-diphosphocytidyl-2-C-methyl-D-erythritol kinase
MAELTVRAPAKTNLLLSVGDRRADGFHDLTTVFHAVSLYDDVTLSTGSAGITVHGEGAGAVPTGPDNLAAKAVSALARHLNRPKWTERVHVTLHKRIPVAGGMAGGSADAAATLVGLVRLWDVEVADEDLLAIAAELGSDVPFALHGCTALGTGRGEHLTPVTTSTTLHWVVAFDQGTLSTPVVFAELDRLRAAGTPERAGPADELLTALATGTAHDLAKHLGNDLEAAALSLRPSLGVTLDTGLTAGALAGLVSGSGPTCVFLAADAESAEAIAGRLAELGACRTTVVAQGPVTGARLVAGPEPR